MVSNSIRKQILTVLAEEETMRRADLAEVLAAAEEIPTADTRTIEIALHHNHLPRLDDENVIEYDVRTGDIVLWEDPERVRARLRDE